MYIPYIYILYIYICLLIATLCFWLSCCRSFGGLEAMKLGWFTAAQWIRSCIRMIDTAQSAQRRTKQQPADWVATRGTSLAITSRSGRWHWKSGCGLWHKMIGAPKWTHLRNVNIECKGGCGLNLRTRDICRSVMSATQQVTKYCTWWPGWDLPPPRQDIWGPLDVQRMFWIMYYFGHQSIHHHPSLSCRQEFRSLCQQRGWDHQRLVWSPMSNSTSHGWPGGIQLERQRPRESALPGHTSTPPGAQASPWWQLRISFKLKLNIWNYKTNAENTYNYNILPT